jgi:hypothetical protein
MPLQYVFDENLRGVPWQAVQRYNQSSALPIDVVRVGDRAELPRGTADPDLLRWAQRAGRIVVTVDVATLPVHFAAHLGAGGHSAGMFIVMGWVPMPTIIDRLVLAAYASAPEEWQDRIYHITR